MPIFWVPFIVKSVLVGTEHCVVRLRHSRTPISKARRVYRPFFGSLYLENNVYLVILRISVIADLCPF